MTVIAGLSSEDSEATILIRNFGTQYRRYDLALRGLSLERHFIYEKYTVDAHHDLDLIKSENIGVQALTMSEEVEIRSVCLLRLKPFP